jgi:Fe-S cluster assembly protein SufD
MLRLQRESRAGVPSVDGVRRRGGGGTYDSFALALGGRLGRMETFARLGGAEAAAHLNAAQLFGDGQHGDFTTTVSACGAEYAEPTDGEERADRAGARRVPGQDRGRSGRAEDRRVSDEPERCCFRADAEIDSKPQLEIYADDVKCSHGATVGELDAEQLFYLRSRGVPEGEARTMLIRALPGGGVGRDRAMEARAAFDGAIAAWWEAHP